MTDQHITTLTHGAATCKIHSFGATVLSFTSDNGCEHLFLSRDVVLDGSRPIRGGIPVVFPIFGPPGEHDGSMPQHGFARCNFWKLEKIVNDLASSTAFYSLQFKDVTQGLGENNTWSKSQAALDGTDCSLEYEVHLEDKQLTTSLIIKNTGSDAFNFNCLLHNYFAVDNAAALDAAKTHIDGLGGYAINDKILGDNPRVQSYDEPVVVGAAQEIDAVLDPPEGHHIVRVMIAAGTTTPNICLEAAGQVNNEVTSVSCVVWNPGKTKAEAMSDFGSDQYTDMICVEPGLLGHQPLLNPGMEARLTQSIIVL
jgi:glucose-6-phosphate 1-epimerase